MASLLTDYSGLTLKNPIIVGSSGLTDSVEKNVVLEKHGAAAIVLKSLFEEEIALEHADMLDKLKADGRRLEVYEDYDYTIRSKNLKRYKDLIQETKERVSIPVIASVNCVYSHEWASFASQLQEAGADALELNMFVLPSDPSLQSQQVEERYYRVAQRVRKEVSIPIAVKVSYYFSTLARTLQQLSETGIAALVLFNRFYSPDFDIESFNLLPTYVFSSPDELPISLRWVALLSGRVECDIAASTGVHDATAMIKQLLAGANAVQIASTLYKHGPQHIQTMLQELETWMVRHRFDSIEDFRGRLSQAKNADPSVYERVQFMKYFSGGEEAT